MVCYAVNDEESWEKLKFWIAELKKMEENCRIYICCNNLKADKYDFFFKQFRIFDRVHDWFNWLDLLGRKI